MRKGLPLPPVFDTRARRLDTTSSQARMRELVLAAPDDVRALMQSNADALLTLLRLTRLMPPSVMRRHASLTIRCQDCQGGRAVAWVAWVEGRPLFVGDYGPGRMMVSLLDVPTFAAPTFRCRSHTWRLTHIEDLPGPGGAPRTRRVTHADE